MPAFDPERRRASAQAAAFTRHGNIAAAEQAQQRLAALRLRDRIVASLEHLSHEDRVTLAALILGGQK